MSKQEKRIGFVLGYLTEDYETSIWRGLMSAATASGVRLVGIDGGAVNDPYAFYRQKATLYKIIHHMGLDGIIVLSGSVGSYVHESEFEEFLNTLPNIPQVLIGKACGDRALIQIDNHSGMYRAVNHLIQVHHRRKLAFIAGPPTNEDACQRLEAYKQALFDNDIEYDPKIVYEGTFDRADGIRGVKAIWEDEWQRPDALAASNDYMALYAIEELRRRGFLIPANISVSGFDDIRECAAVFPPLSSVAQPFDDIGTAAIAKMLDLIAGKDSPPVQVLSTSLVIRGSCGCIIPPKYSVAEAVLSHDIGINVDDDGLIFGDDVIFYAWLEEKMRNDKSFNPSCAIWYERLGALFDYHMEKCSSEDKRYFLSERRSRVNEFIGRRAEEFQKTKLVRSRDSFVVLNRFYDQTTFSFDPDAIDEALNQSLNHLGVKAFMMGLYREGDFNKAHIAYLSKLCETAGLVLGLSAKPAQLITLFMKKVSPLLTENFLLLPLYHRCEDIGFLILNVGIQDGVLYESLTNQLGNCLKGSALVREVTQHAEILERRVADRTMELQEALERLENSNRLLSQLSILDELSGLYNRRGFYTIARNHFELAPRNKNEFILFYIDLDDMKGINDQYGHKEGDIALCATAGLLKDCFRQTDLIARMGGDEFTVLAINMKIEEVGIALTRLKKSSQEWNLAAAKPYHLEMSVGYAAYDSVNHHSIEDLMADADASLYAEKGKRKGKC